MDLNDKQAGVMVLHELESDCLILTQRSFHLPEHPGEICFPGGRWQVGDKTLKETALRELEEELGISAQRVQILKEMIAECTLSGYWIKPWFAVIEQLKPYQENLNEVSEVIFLPLKQVQQKENYQTKWVERKGVHFETCYFITPRHVVWGATARIMQQLILTELLDK